MGWVEIDRSVRPPFKIKDPDNFKAGRLKVEEDGTVKNTGISTDFSDRKNIFSSEEALQDFFEIADITLVE